MELACSKLPMLLEAMLTKLIGDTHTHTHVREHTHESFENRAGTSWEEGESTGGEKDKRG